MTRRGRPPHPDVLTPREWDVLTLVREGLTNPQIAERLSITMDAVKYHVSEILSKLALSSREEAAAWQPEPAERAVLRPSWASALAALFRSWPLAIRFAGALVVAAAVAGLGILLYGVVHSDDSDDATSQPSSTAAVSATPTASPGGSSFVVREPTDLPADLALLIQVGGGETSVAGLERVTRSADGRSHQDILFWANGDRYEAKGVNLPTPVPDAPLKADAGVRAYISGYGVSANGSAIVVSLCVRGECGGVNGAANGQAEAALYQSLDGGVTWAESSHVTGGGVAIRGIDSSGHALVELSVPGTQVPEYFWEPGRSPVYQPPQATGAPSVLSDDRLVWPGDLGWYFGDWTPAAVVPFEDSGYIFSPIMQTAPDEFAALTLGTLPILTVSNAGGVLASYTLPYGVDVAASLGKGTYLGLQAAAAVPGVHDATETPVLINTSTGTITPFASPFTDAGFEQYQPFVYIAGAYPQANFDRVTSADPCLEVHAAPDASSPIVACLANDVLVIDLLTSDKIVADTPIPGWRDVLTLDRIHGYADSENLPFN